MPSQELVEKGLNALDWTQKVVEVINGKAGGKPEAAMGTGSNINSVDDAVKVAEEFARLKLN